MGLLSPREYAVAVLAIAAIVLWIFGGSHINATAAALVVVSIMLFVGVVTWDDICLQSRSLADADYLATLVTLADGLNRTGFVGSETIAGSMSGLSPSQTIIGSC